MVRDLLGALQAYGQMIEADASAVEADHARSQGNNIVSLGVPAAELLTSPAALAVRHLERCGRGRPRVRDVVPTPKPPRPAQDTVRSPLADPSVGDTGVRSRAFHRIAMVGSHMPRQCGNATVTIDLRDALRGGFPELDSFVLAMADPGGRPTHPSRVRFELRKPA